MISWPDQLIKDLRVDALSLCLAPVCQKILLGEGGETPLTWRQFLDKALEKAPPKSRHIVKAIKSGDYLSACEWIKNRMDEQ